MKPTMLLSIALLTVSTALNAAKVPVVSEKTLLKEMINRENLARFPDPSYKTVQFSSYDRASVSSDRPGWYANGDANVFLRDEVKEGRVERVMVDTEGPGAIVRFWMTLAGGENGIVRIYIDGSETPCAEAPVMDLLSGEALTTEPLASSVSKLTPKEQRGHDLYYPIPYAKSCKVTYQMTYPASGCAYYNIECRQYISEVNVIPFSGKPDKETLELAAQANRILGEAPVKPAKAERHEISATLAPGEECSSLISGSKAVEYLSLSLSAQDYPQAMRSTVLSIEFDGEPTVWVPVGDFFGVGYSPVHHRTFYNSAEPYGKLEAFWVMPFNKECRITLHNLGTQTVGIAGEALCKKWKWDSRSMHFGAGWYQLTDYKTGAINRAAPADINFVTLQGQGVYVGDATAIFNTTGSWWGEGDEKVYVDGESFPSHFGTGSEDYYGYAWCAPPVYTDHPFLSLPIGSGNIGIGRTVNNRYRALDAITFNESLRFDIEIFEWDEARIIYAPVTFWYLKPGGNFSCIHDVEGAKEPVVMTREQFLKPVLSSYIEGEDMTVESCDGKQYIQYYGGSPWAYKTAIFMHFVPEGGRLVLSFESPYEAEVRADAILGTARDYASVNLYFNGERLAENVNLWNFEVSATTVPMGKVKLRKGRNTVEIEISKLGRSHELGIASLDRMIFYSL